MSLASISLKPTVDEFTSASSVVLSAPITAVWSASTARWSVAASWIWRLWMTDDCAVLMLEALRAAELAARVTELAARQRKP